MSIICQVLSTGIASFLCMTMGIMFTWPSSTFKLFSSVNTTLDRPMAETELALLGSLSSISGLISTPFSSYFLDQFGRKNTCFIFSFMQVVSWIIVIACNKVEAALASIFISGLSSCLILAVPIYIGEICQESIRGMMSSLSMIFYGVGMLVSYLLGGFLEYKVMNYTCLTLALTGFALVTLLKESPLYLLTNGFEKEAKRSIAFFRGVKVDSKEVSEEMETLQRALNPDLDDATPEEEKLNPIEKPKEKLSFWKFMRKSRSSRRALLMTLILYTASIFQGLVVVQVYAEPLFEEAIPNMSWTVSSVLFATITIIAGLVAAYLIDWWGRRPLIIYGSLGGGICCVVLGSQISLHWGPHWVTALFIYLFSILYTIGAGTVPYVMTAEVFLPEVKSVVSMISMEWAFVCYFVILFIFNPLVAAIGLGPVFFLFAAVCFLTSVYSVFYVPETMGLTVDVIQMKFNKRQQKPHIELERIS
ncbi:facilitated trehalose transporter Tret1-like [Epargyreus clarus]|uniref:facilitated trehalose transporter Tret1-like n=1 Tax=Epargyreus clarus TaxID=520877 RepID=UPI003C306A63